MLNADTARAKAEEGISLFKAAVLLFALLSGLLVLAFGADWLLRTDNFPVRQVRFEGEFKRVTQQELEAAVVKAVHGNFFLLNLDAVKARVEALPWVYTASVRRQWPQDVHVRFTEQQLAARWSDGAFLNQAGDIARVDLRYANGFAVQQAGARVAGHRDTPGRTDAIGTERTGAAKKG